MQISAKTETLKNPSVDITIGLIYLPIQLLWRAWSEKNLLKASDRFGTMQRDINNFIHSPVNDVFFVSKACDEARKLQPEKSISRHSHNGHGMSHRLGIDSSSYFGSKFSFLSNLSAAQQWNNLSFVYFYASIRQIVIAMFTMSPDDQHFFEANLFETFLCNSHAFFYSGPASTPLTNR